MPDSIQLHQEAMLKRLARVEGQIRGIQGMIKRGEDCAAVAQQFAASRKAPDKAYQELLACLLEEAELDPTRDSAPMLARVRAILTKSTCPPRAMDLLLAEALGIGLILGLLLGLTGAGGSLVALPLLLSLHLPLRDAIGVSLGAVAMSALIGAIPRARLGQVAWRPALLLALTGLPGNALGQWLGRFVPETALVAAFCLLVLWSAWRLWRSSGQ